MWRHRSTRPVDPTSGRHRRRPGGVAVSAVVVIAASVLPVASVAAVVQPTTGPDLERECGQRHQLRLRRRHPPGLGQGPPLSPLHLAMVHGAIYDAVNAIDGGHEPYLAGPVRAGHGLKAAAVAQAAHDVLFGFDDPDADRTASGRGSTTMLAASLAGRPRPGHRQDRRHHDRRPGGGRDAAGPGQRRPQRDRRPVGCRHRPRRVAAGAAALQPRGGPLRRCHAAHPQEHGPAPDRGPARPDERAVHHRIQRGQAPRGPGRLDAGRRRRPPSPASSARTRSRT